MPPVWLIPFIPQFFELLFECIKNRSEKKVRKGLRKPGRREIWGMAKVLRREGGFRGRELRAKTYEGIAALENATDRQIDNFITCGTSADFVE